MLQIPAAVSEGIPTDKVLFPLLTSFCKELHLGPFWVILVSSSDASRRSGKIERQLGGKRKDHHLEVLRNGNADGSCQEAGEGRMGKGKEWKEDFQWVIGWNVDRSRNGWNHHSQTWS